MSSGVVKMSVWDKSRTVVYALTQVCKYSPLQCQYIIFMLVQSPSLRRSFTSNNAVPRILDLVTASSSGVEKQTY